MTANRQFPVSRLRLEPAPGVPEIRLYRAHPGSGLSAWLGEDATPPYWAYGWAGGTVLARHVLDHGDTVRGRTVLDAGTGSGIVAIAAALAGAAEVTAVDSDPHAVEVARHNAEANGAKVRFQHADTTASIPDADLILAGDVVYDREVAAAMAGWLSRCRAAGIEVLLGDPGRTFLPLSLLNPVASYPVPDFGQGGLATGTVYRFR